MKSRRYPKKNTVIYPSKRKIGIIVIFILLVLVSSQHALLTVAEKDLGYHMILEHTLFFLIGADICAAS